MVTTMLLLPSIIILLILPSTHSSPVLDVDGHSLKPTHSYYILPLLTHLGGGLTLETTTPTSTYCSYYVAQEKTSTFHGIPFTFTPANASATVILEWETEFNVEFHAWSTPSCNMSRVWSLEEVGGRRNIFVSGNGVGGRPGAAATVRSWFRVEEAYHGDYRLVFCPDFCRRCRKPNCGALDVVVKSGKRFLVLGSDFPVVF